MLAQIAFFAHLAAIPFAVAFICYTDRMPRSSWLPFLLIAGCAAFALLSFRISDPYYAFWDFHNAYYPAGKVSMASARQLREMTDNGVNGFVNMPVISYLFLPLALLPELTATYLFLALGVLAAVAAWFLLARAAGLGAKDRWLLLLLFAVNGPLFYSLKIGNTSQFVLLALAGSLLLLRAGYSTAAGVLLGCFAMIKPPLLLLGLFFLLRRDVRGGFGFFAACAGIAALSIGVFGWSDNWHWFEVCIIQFSHQWLAAYNVQSVPAFMLRFDLAPSLLEDWNARQPPPDLAILANIFFGLLFALAAAALWRRAARHQASLPALELQYSLIICLAIVASPLSWSHYYCWLLLPAALFLRWRHQLPRLSRICGWLAIMLVTPVIRLLHFAEPWMWEFYKNAAVSLLLFGGLLWFGLVAWWVGMSVASSAAADKPCQNHAHSWVFRRLHWFATLR
ncbi:MAG TPA: glycosyltransferase 87 family protein [Rhizomicrobium sp.]|jgi:hypothetical protein|nr:glycosyltransferase 87 family protein [Rhizomicrobium sp.]